MILYHRAVMIAWRCLIWLMPRLQHHPAYLAILPPKPNLKLIEGCQEWVFCHTPREVGVDVYAADRRHQLTHHIVGWRSGWLVQSTISFGDKVLTAPEHYGHHCGETVRKWYKGEDWQVMVLADGREFPLHPTPALALALGLKPLPAPS